MAQEQVILVNEQNVEIGLMEKMEAHEKGLLHRAFSIFIFNDKSELLLQRRALNKYHSGGLWTNTCCSHPKENETIIEAADRRLIEEMGFSTKLEEKFSFIYKAKLDQGLTEHELDFVLFGSYSQNPLPNSLEVDDWKYVSIDFLKSDLNNNPSNYTAWFKVVFDKVIKTFYNTDK